MGGIRSQSNGIFMSIIYMDGMSPKKSYGLINNTHFTNLVTIVYTRVINSR